MSKAKKDKKEFKNSRLLVTIISILVFMFVVFISYAFYGGGRGTFSACSAEIPYQGNENDAAVQEEIEGWEMLGYTCSGGVCSCFGTLEQNGSLCSCQTEKVCGDGKSVVVDTSTNQSYCCPTGYRLVTHNSTHVCLKEGNYSIGAHNGVDMCRSQFDFDTEAACQNAYNEAVVSGEYSAFEHHCDNTGSQKYYLAFKPLSECKSNATAAENPTYAIFHANGGTYSGGLTAKAVTWKYNSNTSQYSAYGMPVPTKNNDSFEGYSDDKNCSGGVVYNGTNVPKSSTAATDDFYACWQSMLSGEESGGNEGDTELACYSCVSGADAEFRWSFGSPGNSCTKYANETPCEQLAETCWECDSSFGTAYTWSSSKHSDCRITNAKFEEACGKNYSVVLDPNGNPWQIIGSDDKPHVGTAERKVLAYDDQIRITSSDFPKLYDIARSSVSWYENRDCTTGRHIDEYFDSQEGTAGDTVFYACVKSTVEPSDDPTPSGGTDPTPSGGTDPTPSGGTDPTPSGGTDPTPSGGTDPTPSGDNEPTTSSVPFDDIINGDRCYDGSWVRVTKCQAESLSDAKCQLSDGRVVSRHGDDAVKYGLGCKDLTNAYSEEVNDYRCDRELTQKWIYISTCQPSSLIGAKCKTSMGTIIRTHLTEGNGCSGDKPSNPNKNKSKESDDDYDSTEFDETSESPFTGTTEFIVAIFIGLVALGVSFYYFGKGKLFKKKG